MTGASRTGGSDRFRPGGWLERTVDWFRRGSLVPAPPVARRAYEAVLDRIPGDHLVSVLPEGERIQLAAKYRHVTWNPDEYRAFRAAVCRGVTVLDVGANVGAYTLMFATWVGERGRVVAFEPAPAACEGLRTHLSLNHLEARVTIIEAAASSSVGEAPFAVHPSGGSSALAPAGAGARSHITVPTETIDHVCRTHALIPAVIKIDVEGAELDVLRGARHTLALPGLHVFVEFHPEAWRQAGTTRADIEAEVRAHGFSVEPLDPSYDPWTTEGVCVRLRRR